MLKQCSKCKIWKPISEFYKHKNRKDGLCYQCKECCKKIQAKYYQRNREQILEQGHKYRETHKKEIAKYKKVHKEEKVKYRIKNRKQIAKYNHQWYLNHKEETRRRDSKRRDLGYNPLNKWFEGAVSHHINNTDVVFIPREIHQKFSDILVEKHRNAILNYYGSIERMINNNPQSALTFSEIG